MHIIRMEAFIGNKIALKLKKYILLYIAVFMYAFLSPLTLKAADQFVLQLRWDPQFQFAGYYAALWQGYYSDANLDITIRSAWHPDKKILTATDEVANGRADFGVGAGEILRARDTGTPLVLLASFFQRSSVELYVRNDIQVETLADLTKLKVFRIINDIPDVEFQAMLRAEGIDPDSVPSIPNTSYSESERKFANGETDAHLGYSIASPYRMQSEIIKPKVLRAENYGIAFYGDSLFTHQRVIDKNQEAVERFIEASKKGWAYAMQHPGEIAKRLSMETLNIVPVDDPLAYNLFQAKRVRELMLYPNVEVGNVNPARWEKMNDHLRDAGFVKNDFDLEQFIFNPQRAKEKLYQIVLKVAAFGVFAITGLLVIFYYWNNSLRKEAVKRTSLLTASEHKYRNLIENQSLLACQFLPDTTITYANEAYVEFFTDYPESLIGKKLSDFVPKANIEKLLTHLETFTPDNAIQKREEQYLKQDGKKYWFIWNNEAIFDDAGDIAYFQSFATDITETKLIEQRLMSAKKMEVVGQLTAGIAHDFNNLLQIIQTNLELANLKIHEKNQIKDLIGSAIDAGKRGRSLIQKLTSSSRGQPINYELINPNDEIEETLRLLNRTMGVHIMIVPELGAEVPNIFTDLNDFQNALLNLAVNARNAMQDGGVLKFSTVKKYFPGEYSTGDIVLLPGEYVEIDVVDDGCGMAQDVLEKATEPYFTTREVGEGSGLGLSAVYGFCRQSKGGFEIMSALGEGTTVRMILPAARDIAL
jgi:PAS domain S-box-containing protein